MTPDNYKNETDYRKTPHEYLNNEYYKNMD